MFKDLPLAASKTHHREEPEQPSNQLTPAHQTSHEGVAARLRQKAEQKAKEKEKEKESPKDLVTGDTKTNVQQNGGRKKKN